MAKKTSWLAALEDSKLRIRSARDAMQVRGYLDTGNYALNWALSGRLLGGYPYGHCGEIFGDPGTGKSFLAARAIAMAQQVGGVALLDDIEHAYNETHAQRLGINIDELPTAMSYTVKEHLSVVQRFVAAYKEQRPKGPGLCIGDSLAALSTEHELKEQLDKRDMTKAAEVKAFYRIVFASLAELNVIHVFTNHTIASIGSMFQTRSTPGGGGAKFMASWRLDLRAISKIKEGPEVVGTICRAVVDKNRIIAPWKEVRLAIPFNQPLSRASGLIPLLVALGVIEQRGNFLFHEGQKLGRAYESKDKFLAQDETGDAMLDQFPELLEEADRVIATHQTRAVGGGGSVVIGEDDDDATEETT